MNIALVSFPEKVCHQRPAGSNCDSLWVSLDAGSISAVWCVCPWGQWRAAPDPDSFNPDVRDAPASQSTSVSCAGRTKQTGRRRRRRRPLSPEGFPFFSLNLHPNLSSLLFYFFFYAAHFLSKFMTLQYFFPLCDTYCNMKKSRNIHQMTSEAWSGNNESFWNLSVDGSTLWNEKGCRSESCLINNNYKIERHRLKIIIKQIATHWTRTCSGLNINAGKRIWK